MALKDVKNCGLNKPTMRFELLKGYIILKKFKI
jgi:hypothetical protein